MKPLAVPDTLDAVLDDGWSRLARGAKDRRSTFHTPVVATAGDADVRQRVMVLRAADRATATLRFHSDVRSAKMSQIGDGAAASVLGYDPGARIQIALSGTLAPAGPDVTEAAWQASAFTSRRCYLAEPGPGTPIDGAGSGLPPHLLDRAPTPKESLAGRTNFVALVFAVSALEWLELTSAGNRRAAFVRRGTGWEGQWLIP